MQSLPATLPITDLLMVGLWHSNSSWLTGYKSKAGAPVTPDTPALFLGRWLLHLPLHSILLQQPYAALCQLLAHGFRPDAYLHLTDVGFAQHEHAHARLTDATADALGQFFGEQQLVEG